MTRIELAPAVADDFDRIIEHLEKFQPEQGPARIHEIIQAINVLEHNPLIGRPVADGKRELIIGRHSRGYVALYRYLAEIDSVFILALRARREAGYVSD